MPQVTPCDLRRKLLNLCVKCGSQRRAASELGISAQYLNDVLHGKREPGDKLLMAIGLQKIVRYIAR